MCTFYFGARSQDFSLDIFFYTSYDFGLIHYSLLVNEKGKIEIEEAAQTALQY